MKPVFKLKSCVHSELSFFNLCTNKTALYSVHNPVKFCMMVLCQSLFTFLESRCIQTAWKISQQANMKSFLVWKDFKFRANDLRHKSYTKSVWDCASKKHNLLLRPPEQHLKLQYDKCTRATSSQTTTTVMMYTVHHVKWKSALLIQRMWTG